MHAFRRTRSGYATRMDATERAIVASVVGDVAELLGHGVGSLGEDGPDASASTEGAGAPPADDGLPVISWDEPDEASSHAPLDPALARLLPSASEDDGVAGEVRRLTEDSIRSAKGERLQRVWWDLQTREDEIRVPDDRAMVWAGALTDVRLVLAQRLGVEDADAAERLTQVAASSEDEVSRALASLYLALSWLQESLVEAMLQELPTAGTTD
ncbi:DUF2017 domain-containing protein [Serinibacter arcticus]|uniref:DUF2017 domain-containing protein n=1 Tax=Serinibacter arcticus TaxID=1655435 RepID=A0A4Z1E6H5_9MICO|nr:DUF2017 domain-containing protein [Serinibacter arcticus]TGO06063.1 DUF2017 domain-containing protein [Serinibacter arcticus]